MLARQYLTFKFLIGQDHSLLSPVSIPPDCGFTFLEMWGRPNTLPGGVGNGFYRTLALDGWKLDHVELSPDPASEDHLPVRDRRCESPVLWVYSRPAPRH